MDAIFKRRSVRQYTEGRIPDEHIERMLRAAMRAPSAGNERPWEFVVIRERETLLKITEFHPYATMLKTADCAIIVCGDVERQAFEYDFWVQDCAAATQNILLEATHLGVGSVWLAVYPDDKRIAGMRELLHLPDRVIPLCVVSLGYPLREMEPVDGFLPDRVHCETWGE